MDEKIELLELELKTAQKQLSEVIDEVVYAEQQVKLLLFLFNIDCETR